MPVAIPLALGAAAAGAGIAGATAAAAASLTFLGIGAWGWAAISVGLTILSTVAQQMLSPTPPKPQMQEGDVSIRQAIPPRVRLYGRQRIGGAMLYYDSTNDGDLFELVCHCAHEVAEYEEDWLNDQRVQLDADGNVLDDPWWQEDNDDSTVVIVHNLGSPDQAIGHLPNPPWTVNHRGRGLCATRVKYSDLKDEDQLRVFPSGPPPYRVVLKGAKIFDPRVAGTGPGQQNPANEATWQWSDNAALVVLDYLSRTENGIPVGFGIPFARIDLDSFAFAAGVCDQSIPIKVGGVVAGVEKRWRSWGAYELTEDRKDVLKDLLDACAGRLIQGPDGKIGLDVGAGKYRITDSDPDGDDDEWTIPVGVPVASVTLGEEQLFGWDLTNGKTAIERVNEVRATYVSEAWNWAETEAGIQTDEDGIGRNGTETSQIKLRFVPSESQAQRVAREVLRRGNPTWIGTIRTTLAGLDAWGERWLGLQISELEISGIFEITGMRLDRSTMMVEIDVQTYDDWWDWTASSDEKLPAVPPPTVDDDAEVPVPTGVTVTIVHRQINAQMVAAVGVIKWGPPPRSIYTARARYRPVTVPVSPWQSLPVAQDGLQVETNPLADGQGYEAQVRFIGSGGGGGDFSASVNFTAVADPVAPPAPSSLTAQQGVPATGQVTVTATAPNSPKHASLRFYRNTTASFVGATLIEGPIYCAPGSVRSYVDAPGTGDFWYYATSANFSNVESTAFGPVAAEVLPASPAITSPGGPINTNDNRLPISGSGITGATIKLYANAVQVGTGTVSGGVWTVTPSTPYGNGVNAITATQTVAGNESAASGAVSVTVATLDTDARAYIDAMTSRPSSARMGDINTFILALKTAGIWTKFDHFYLLAAHHEQASRLSLKTPGSFTLVATTLTTAPTFTVDRGWLGGGAGTTAGGYLASSFNATVGTNQLQQDSCHQAVWVHQASSGTVTGTFRELGGGQTVMATKNATAVLYCLANAASPDAIPQTGDGTGFYAWSRQSAANYHGYQDTSDLGATARVSAALVAGAFSVLRGGSGFSNARVSAACWGAGLSGAEVTALRNALRAYMVAVGAAV